MWGDSAGFASDQAPGQAQSADAQRLLRAAAARPDRAALDQGEVSHDLDQRRDAGRVTVFRRSFEVGKAGFEQRCPAAIAGRRSTVTSQHGGGSWIGLQAHSGRVGG